MAVTYGQDGLGEGHSAEDQGSRPPFVTMNQLFHLSETQFLLKIEIIITRLD